MYIIFDTETTGLPRDWNAPVTDTDNWPRCVQIAWQIHDDMGRLVEAKDYLVKPDGFDIPFDAERIHGISTELAEQQGIPIQEVLEDFNRALGQAKFVVGQNIGFDLNIMGAEFYRYGVDSPMLEMKVLDTCTEDTANLCQIPGGRGGKYKLPTLTELHSYLFGEPFAEAHNATADVEATTRCFLELVRRGEFSIEQLDVEERYIENFKEFNPQPIGRVGLKHLNLKAESDKIRKATQQDDSLSTAEKDENKQRLSDVDFVHLHNHSQFSILQSTIDVKALVNKAVELNMPGVALTDSGNMMAVFHFEKYVSGYNKKIKAERQAAEEKGEPYNKKELIPVIGAELNICKDRNDKRNKDNGYAVVFLAKNKNGYHNLAKMASIAYTEGFYYVPRIDREIVEKYKEDLIVLTGNLSGEVPNLILNVGEQQAEEALVWWKERFGEDLYIELMRHGQEDEDRVNTTLLKFSQTHAVKIVATNNTYYLNKEDAKSHDILLCVKDGELVSTPKGRGRGFRYGLDNEEYYFKSTEEMKKLFIDLPEAIENTNEILAKCEPYALAREILLPAFDFPEEFKDPEDEKDGGKRGENNYLRYLTYEGARKRYGEVTDAIRERLDFELDTIANTGYPGYFLIVQDFCQAARDMGVSVGPGRGSAAGSAVAYCIGITNVDPIQYDLLFERFLNPERVSMPDIDIDFDDEGRGRVIDWVIDKYGANQVAQIITYGTMAAKSSIRDTARVLDLPLPDADRLAKLVPDISLAKLFGLDDAALADKLKNNSDDIQKVNELKKIAEGKDLMAQVVNQARNLEGSVRNTGIHACGVIITPDDITNFVPVATAKDSDMWCTQFDNSVAEEAGLLKMDFLGLKTLTLIKDAVRNVKLRHGIELDPDHFPIDDEKTYELFQRGETVGIFQYESPGMQKYMKELKPTVFADLIAMNALYRPGPLEYIPSFIRRKNGDEEIEYDLDACKEYLEETYGITVYQEQVMLLSQKLANFTKGEADVLRKAMGKKQADVLAKMKPKFVEQAKGNGHPEDKLEKIWRDWEAFASYAFNKSHSTCYAWIAYQTAYLKANYPAEYMASVLSNNMNDISKVTFFMEECRRSGIPVLGPDVNESQYKFVVNQEGAIRFGMGAIKGVGSAPIMSIVQNREENGPYRTIFDFASRVDLKVCNKKAFEGLALAGGFDSFEDIHRAQYFTMSGTGRLFLEDVMKYGANIQQSEESAQVSMFGDSETEDMPEPIAPNVEEWSSLVKLSKEKEVVGIFISGHPLDDFKVELEAFCNAQITDLENVNEYVGKELKLAGIVTEVEHRFSKKGNPFGTISIEDYSGGTKLFLFGEDYLRFKHFMVQGTFLYLTGKVVNKMYRNDEFEFKINAIELLGELRDKLVRSLSIKLSSSDVTPLFVQEMHELISGHSGKCQLKFSIQDPTTGIEVNMPSKTMKVDVSGDLLKKLESMRLEFVVG
ncbi:DNA polymerase III subunit alpha [Wandonia haliotis]|uniref:DNA polymerase III subunit alpha n=1 Tax=Wandonia haliotis TaxID=574963 RepID=A0ABP3Y8M9_9FLAO